MAEALPTMLKMTVQERELLEAIGKVMVKFQALPILHPSDVSETARDIYNIQNRILARASYPHSLREVD